MFNNSRAARLVGAAGVSLLIASLSAGVAMGDPSEVDDTSVDVNVNIAEVEGPGFLALTVADDSVQLTENGSDVTRRQFTGTLPTVTVTDTRDSADIPAGAGWAVLGTVSDFTGGTGQAAITADHLGWAPELVGNNTGDGLVSEGDVVDTVLDGGANGVGLENRELLVSTWDSAAVHEEGSWQANAELFLRTPLDVEAGEYSAVLTLSLFE